MSLYVTEGGGRQRWRGRRQGVEHILCGLGERAIYHLSAAWMYKLFRQLEIYILYNYFGSIVSDKSQSSQANALN